MVTTAPTTESVAAARTTAKTPSATSGVARPDGAKPLASPAVRQRAWELGIALQYVPASGS
ncbi:E3 binding domain-containing protein, partial [Vibrio cholerae O1]|uniref:E3 binding domain-containing protein n=1 Tax=Vibrio cholerae TaxID=666 RepID=UPI001C1214F3|nr:E3 binding domain-containing protein [Vibrio cholerae O1]